jgi:hypothetical protein
MRFSQCRPDFFTIGGISATSKNFFVVAVFVLSSASSYAQECDRWDAQPRTALLIV